MKESCVNCKHRNGCLRRDAAIFFLFIATGRDYMVPEARESMNIRPSCDQWAPQEQP